MSKEILDYLVSFLKVFFGQKWQRRANIEHFLNFFLSIVSSYSRYGYYGASLSKAYRENKLIDKLTLSAITGKVNKAQLFSSAVKAGSMIIDYSNFKEIPEDIQPEQHLIEYIAHFSVVMRDHMDFMVVSFLGSQFNQEKTLVEQVCNFRQEWVTTISELIESQWNSKKLAKYIAENSLTYLLGQLYWINTTTTQVNKQKIKYLCDSLYCYWTGSVNGLLGECA